MRTVHPQAGTRHQRTGAAVPSFGGGWAKVASAKAGSNEILPDRGGSTKPSGSPKPPPWHWSHDEGGEDAGAPTYFNAGVRSTPCGPIAIVQLSQSDLILKK
jgi:hypothetical protein